MIFAIAGVLFVLWTFAVIKLGVWREWHHEYIGAALVMMPWTWVQVVGLAVMADDAFQHLAQLEHPTYLSPLHRLWDWIARHF